MYITEEHSLKEKRQLSGKPEPEAGIANDCSHLVAAKDAVQDAAAGLLQLGGGQRAALNGQVVVGDTAVVGLRGDAGVHL